MDQTTAASPGDPAAADTAEGLRLARELGVAGEMRSAGERIQGNQLGQATQQQQLIENALREILDTLSGRSRTGTAEQPSGPGQQTLEDVKRMQEEINRRTQELEKWRGRPGKPPDEARRQYETLGGQQSRLGELLRRMSTPPPESPAEPKP